jgi:hypothetical protein
MIQSVCAKTPEKTVGFEMRAAPGAAIDTELARLIAAWPTLPETDRAKIVSFIRTD